MDGGRPSASQFATHIFHLGTFVDKAVTMVSGPATPTIEYEHFVIFPTLQYEGFYHGVVTMAISLAT